MSSSSASGPSSGTPSRSRRMASRRTAKALSHLSQSQTHPTRARKGRTAFGAIAPSSRSNTTQIKSAAQLAFKEPVSKKPVSKKPLRAPRPVRQMVRWLVRGPQKSPRKVLMAGGSVATLAVLAIVPTRVGSQAIALSSCQEVVQSGAEISRAQVASLLALPEGSRREAVRQAIDVPYCLLPTQKEDVRASESVSEKASESANEKASKQSSETITHVTATAREAYPLAFDPEAWVVVRYSEGAYVGYDFVFKP